MADAPIAQLKTCTKCGQSRPIDNFCKDKTRSDGLFSWCRHCKRAAARADYRANPAPYIERAARKRESDPGAMRSWRAANADHVKAYNAAYAARDPEATRERHARYGKENAEKRRAYRLKHIERERENKRRHRLSSPKRRLNETVARAIGRSLNGTKAGKHWEDLVGYTTADLVAHLEKQFLPGMTWENRGLFGWHIDHIVPLRAFNFSAPDHIDFKRAWALSNLRPLWWRDNLKKHGKIERPFQPSLAL